MMSLPPSGIASRALSARLRSAVASWLGSTIARQISSSNTDSISTCSPSVGRSSFAVSMISVLTSVSRGCSGCLRANASRCWVSSAPREAASSIIRVMAASCGSSFDRVGEDLDRAGDDGQDIVEVMGDAAGELADGFHLLRLPDPVLGRDLVGEVADEAVEDEAVAALQRGDAELDLEFPVRRAAAPRSRGGGRGSAPSPVAQKALQGRLDGGAVRIRDDRSVRRALSRALPRATSRRSFRPASSSP